jgi:hypothetical protein
VVAIVAKGADGPAGELGQLPFGQELFFCISSPPFCFLLVNLESKAHAKKAVKLSF